MADKHRAVTDVEINGQNAATVLDTLKSKADAYRKAMVEANKANDLQGYKKAEAELAKTERTMKQLQKTSFDVNTVMKNLSTTTQNDLTRAQRQLQTELKKTTRGTAEYIEKSKQLRLVSAELQRVRAEMNGVAGSQQGMLSKFVNGFNRFGGVALGTIAAVTGIGLSLRKLAQDADAYNSKVAELSAITGLAGEELNWLSEEAKRLSVSTTEDGVSITKSADEIVDAFKLMGSAKPELLENKEALAAVTTEALKLAEAAKMDTATAVESLANVMNQFGAEADEASKYINVLAAGSKFGAAAVDSIAASIVKFGPAAAMANVSVEESVGLIETLAEKGVKGEIAGTKLKMALLKLQIGADEFNPKVVGLNKALENLSNANLSAAELTKIFGMEAFDAGQILIANRERVEYFTDAVTDTNVAIEQAIINTETNSAALEQAKNRFKLAAMELGQRLAPAFRTATLTSGTLVKAIIALVKFFDQYGKYILIAAAGIAGYTIAVNAATIAKKLYTIAIKVADIATKAFSSSVKANPIGLLIGVLTMAASAFFIFRKKVDDTTESQKKLNDVLKEGQDLIESFVSIADKMKVADTLSLRQLENLKNNIEKQIEAQEDFSEKLKVEGVKRLNEDANLQTLRKKLDQATDADKRKFWLNLIEKRKKAITEEIRDEYEKQNQILQKYRDYLNTVDHLIKNHNETLKQNEEKKFEDLEKALIDYHNKVRLDIQKSYLLDKINKEQRDAMLEAEEITHLQAMLSLQKNFSIESYDTEYKLTEAKIKLKEKYLNEYERLVKEQERINQEYKTQEEKLEEERRLNNLKRYEERKKKRKEEQAEKQKEVEAQIEELKKQAEQQKAILDTLGTAVGELIAQMATDATMTANDVAKSLILIALDSAHAMARIAIAEIWAKAMPSGESIATWGAAGVAKALLLSAIVEGAFAGLKAAVSSVGQRYSGKYDVIGADDGKRYSASYAGDMKTGLYPTPTLVGERGTELIVDANTLRNVRLNFPDVLPKIRAAMVPQRAEGNVQQKLGDGAGAVDNDLKVLIAQNTAVMKALSVQVKQGINAKLSYTHLENENKKVDRIKRNSSR